MRWPTNKQLSYMLSGEGSYYVGFVGDVITYGPLNKPSARRLRRWLLTQNPHSRVEVTRH